MHLRVGHQHSQFWPILARFLDYYSVFWSRRDFHDLGTPWCVYVSVNDTHNFGQFLSVLCTITHRFGVPERFPLFTIPGCVCVSVVNTHSFGQFWHVSWDCYSPFCGPEVISIVVEPQGALTCRSSILIVLADSSPYHGLLLSFLGPRSDFHD